MTNEKFHLSHGGGVAIGTQTQEGLSLIIKSTKSIFLSKSTKAKLLHPQTLCIQETKL